MPFLTSLWSSPPCGLALLSCSCSVSLSFLNSLSWPCNEACTSEALVNSSPCISTLLSPDVDGRTDRRTERPLDREIRALKVGGRGVHEQDLISCRNLVYHHNDKMEETRRSSRLFTITTQRPCPPVSPFFACRTSSEHLHIAVGSPSGLHGPRHT